MVLGLGGVALTGAWRCLNCRYFTPVNPNDFEDGSIPTCGQRKTQYCAGPCQNMTNFEWATQGYAPPPRPQTQALQPYPQQPPPQQQQRAQHPPQQPPQVPQPNTSNSAEIDLSNMTEERLLQLRQQIDNELKGRAMCAVCLNGPKAIIFYPCKHKVTCTDCADKVEECPVCRTKIMDRINPFS